MDNDIAPVPIKGQKVEPTREYEEDEDGELDQILQMKEEESTDVIKTEKKHKKKKVVKKEEESDESEEDSIQLNKPVKLNAFYKVCDNEADYF